MSASQLRDAVTSALHNLELAYATGPVDLDDMLQRAVALLPEQSRSVYSGRARLALALTGGPLQTVLRPAQLEAQDLRNHLHQISLFGETAVLTTRQGTETAVEGDSIILKQQDRSLTLTEAGSICHVTEIPGSDRGLPVIIEEDVRAVINQFLRFADAVLDHIDPVNRLSHVVLVVKLFGANYLAWRTRTEHERSPNSVQMNTIASDDIVPAHLSPPHITRAELRQNTPELIDDLTVKLRRSLRPQRW